MNEAKMIGQRLQCLRSNGGFSQHELAARSGVAVRSIQEIESSNGNPTIQTIVALSRTLKKDLVLFDVDNFAPREELRRVMKSFGVRHDEMNAQLVELTKNHESLKQKYIKVLESLEASRLEAAMLRDEIKATALPPTIRKIVDILSALDDSQLKRVETFVVEIKNRADRASQGVKNRKGVRNG